MTTSPITFEQLPILGWFGKKSTPPAPAAPDSQLAELQRQIAELRTSFAEQLQVEREERRLVEVKNTDQGKELAQQRGYSEMLQGSLKTVTEAASGLANDISSMRTLLTQADERLKWQADTIDGLKHRITQLEDQIVAKNDENARLTQRLTVVELHNELLVEENAELRAAGRTAGVDFREIELRIQDRRNQAAQRKRDALTVTEPGPVLPGQSPE